MAQAKILSDGTLYAPYIGSSSQKFLGDMYLNLNIECFALGLTPNSGYRIKYDRFKQNVRGQLTERNKYSFDNDGGGTVFNTNSQGDLNGTCQFRISTVPFGSSASAQAYNQCKFNGVTPINNIDYVNANGGAQIFQLDDISGYCFITPITFTFTVQLFTEVNSFIRETEVIVNMKLCQSLYESRSSLPEAIALMTVPNVNLDNPFNYFSLTNVSTSVDRAIVPYNKTTEREVIHLDNRIKST
jgi:hypothetical protein